MLPALRDIFNCNPVSSNCPTTRLPGAQDFTSLGNFISGLLNIGLSIAIFLTFFWLVWGGFQYIAAGGDKQKLAAARSRITWAIVGLLLTMVAFLVAQFAARMLPSQTGVPII